MNILHGLSKKYVLIFIVWGVFWEGAKGQQCSPDSIILDTQEKVNDFNLTEVNGCLVIGKEGGGTVNSTGIQDLTPLKNLKRVRGKLSISNTNLVSLKGLENLQEAESIVISRNTLLTSLTTFSPLLQVCSITIQSTALTSLSGLENLKMLNSVNLCELSINNNKKLTSLKGLENLKEVDILTISLNDILPSLEGLGQLSVLNLFVEENKELRSLNGLENVIVNN
ncbi:MAG: hypothetical protein NW226_04115 [Microscillaceae bacterium]|nr:hypothetical protein [Microscillaceae bacterium]